MSVPHTLIGGGTGFIGKRLVKYLGQYGYNTTVISRTAGVNRISWMQLKENGIPKEVTSVVNLAGASLVDPKKRWTPSVQQDIWNSRIYTNAVIANAVATAPNVHCMLNMSGVSAYKPPELSDAPQKTYTEYDETNVFNYMSKLCVDLEKAAELPKDMQHKCRTIKIRSGVVVGREGGMIQQIWMPFQLGFGGTIGTGKQYLPWIHLDDLVRLIKHCIERDDCDGVLHGVAPEVVTNAQFSKTFATTMDLPCPLAVPEFVVNMLLGEDRASLLLTGAKIIPKRTLETGFHYKYPTIKDACAQLMN